MNKLLVTTALLISLVTLTQTVAVGRDMPWPCFLHDAHNTGRTQLTTFQIPGLKWTVTTGSVVYSGPVVDEGDIVYFGSYDSKLIAVSQDGVVQWEYPTAGEIDSTPLITAAGTIVFGSVDGAIYGVSRTGDPVWSYDTDSSIRRSAPVQAPDGSIIVGTLAGQVVILEADGQLRRIESLSAPIWSSPAVSDDNIVYIGCDDGNLYSFDLMTPGIRWEYPAGSAVRSGVAIGSEGEVYFASIDGLVAALNSDSTERWTYNLEARVDYGSPAIGSDGVLYIGSSTGIHAFNSDGTIKWVWSENVQFRGAPAIDGTGTVIHGADDGKLYAFSPDGQLSWVFATEGLISSAPAIGNNGVLYFGSFDRHLYALAEATPTPTATVTFTPTLSPTVTPSPTPKLPPVILAAGYMQSAISRPDGGSFSMIAWVEDQDGDEIASVDILFNGEAVGQLPPSDFEGFYMIDPVAVGPGLIDGEYYLQLRATDTSGMSSDLWPELTVHEGAGTGMRRGYDAIKAQKFVELLKSHSAGASMAQEPLIAAAGFMRTYLVDGKSGDLTIIAVVQDPAGPINQVSVELFYERQGTGVFLADDGNHDDFAAQDGVFGLSYSGMFGPGFSGIYDFQIRATGSDARQSSLWPYLTVTR